MAIESTCLPAAASADPSRQIGQRLREARLARGEELRDIAAYLRIKPGYLAALEDGDLAAHARPTVCIGLPAQLCRSSGTRRQFAGRAAETSSRAMAMPARAPLEQRRSSWLQTVIMTLAALMLAGTLWTGERSSVPQLGGSAALVAEAPATASPVPNDAAARWPVAGQAAAAGDAEQPPLTMLVSSDSESGSVRSDQNAGERLPVPPVSSDSRPLRLAACSLLRHTAACCA